MNIELLKKLGNVEQLAGIREAQLLRGRGQGVPDGLREIREFIANLRGYYGAI